MAKKALGKGLSSIFEDLGSPVINRESGKEIHDIPLSDITPNPFQPRREFNSEELKQLSESITEKGLLQPILLRSKNQKYEIISGERRFRAFQILNLPSIPAHIRQDVSDRDMMEISLIENIQRVQLSPVEEARAFLRLIEEFGLSHEDIAHKLSKSRSAVTNTLRLLKLHKDVQNLIDLGKISAGHARALILLPEAEQLLIANKIVNEHLSVRSTENMAPSKKQASPRRDPNLSAFEDRLKYSLGSRVIIHGSQIKGRLEIFYHSREELQGIGDTIFRGSGRQNGSQ